MNTQQHLLQLKRGSDKRLHYLQLAKQSVLLVLAVVAFLIYYLLHKLGEALAIVGF